MKVFCALIAAIAAICLPFPTAYHAAAEGSTSIYARAAVTEAYFCTEADASTALFAVPYSYCVRVLGEEGMWYYASYAEDISPYKTVYGYVLKSSLTVLDEIPEVIWLNYTLTVTFSQSSAGNLPSLGDITATAAFYGNYYSGLSGYSYVLCQGSFGYITGSTEDYKIIESTEESTEDSSAEDEEDADGGKIIAGVVLGVLAAAAILIIFMSGRKGGTKGAT